MNNTKWDGRMLRLAAMVASWSRDPSTKVGAVIARPDKTVASVGYNGFPRGMSDHSVLYEDRSQKLSRTVHAEVNAILNAHGPVIGYTMYTTLFPCSNCALLIIQAGIKNIVTVLPEDPTVLERWKESFEKTRGFFAEARVEALVYPNGIPNV